MFNSSLRFIFGIGLFLISSTTLIGQACYGGSCYGGSGSPINELGVRLTSLIDASTAGGYVSPNNALELGIMDGLHYKRYQQYGALRTSIGLTRYEIESNDNCPDCLITDGNVQQVKAKIGYEWFTFFGPIEPYAGFDAVVAFGKYEGETFGRGTGAMADVDYTEIRRKRGFGLAPVVGLRVYVASFVSIGAETTFEAMMYNRETLISNFTSEGTPINRQHNYYETTFHPVSWLSLNILF